MSSAVIRRLARLLLLFFVFATALAGGAHAAGMQVELLPEDLPASALDSAGQEMLAGLMRTHLAGGGMIVAATHGPLGVECKEMRLGWSA